MRISEDENRCYTKHLENISERLRNAIEDAKRTINVISGGYENRSIDELCNRIIETTPLVEEYAMLIEYMKSIMETLFIPAVYGPNPADLFR